MALSRASLLQTLLVAATAVPLSVGCGGKTDDDTGTTTGGGGVSGSSGQGGTSSTGGTGGGVGKIACDSPTPVLVDGKETGLVTCASGALVRVEAKTCPNLIQPTQTCPNMAGGNCDTNADCKGSPYAYCSDSVGTFSCQCTTGCVQDSDCASDELCQCGDPIGRCVKATCHTGADCAEGSCAQVAVGTPGCTTTAFSCQTKTDQCQTDKDCPSNGGSQVCHAANYGQPRVCGSFGCAVGRPLLVEQRLRQAVLIAGASWG